MNLFIDVVIPVIILGQLSGPERLGPVGALVLALAIPVLRSIWVIARERRVQASSMLGIGGVLIVGTISLLQLPSEWIAVKEGMIPLAMAVVMGVAHIRGRNLGAALVLATIDTQKVDEMIGDHDENRKKYRRLLNEVGVAIIVALLISAVVNYLAARLILVAPAGTVEFNEQLGRSSIISFVATLASAGLVIIGAQWRLLLGLRRITGVPVLELLKSGT